MASGEGVISIECLVFALANACSCSTSLQTISNVAHAYIPPEEPEPHVESPAPKRRKRAAPPPREVEQEDQESSAAEKESSIVVTAHGEQFIRRLSVIALAMMGTDIGLPRVTWHMDWSAPLVDVMPLMGKLDVCIFARNLAEAESVLVGASPVLKPLLASGRRVRVVVLAGQLNDFCNFPNMRQHFRNLGATIQAAHHFICDGSLFSSGFSLDLTPGEVHHRHIFPRPRMTLISGIHLEVHEEARRNGVFVEWIFAMQLLSDKSRFTISLDEPSRWGERSTLPVAAKCLLIVACGFRGVLEDGVRLWWPHQEQQLYVATHCDHSSSHAGEQDFWSMLASALDGSN